MSRLPLCLLAFAVVLCLLAPSPAQDDDWPRIEEPDEDEQRPTDPICGRVTDAAGTPIVGATVAGWVNGRLDTRVEVTSGDDGGYELVPSRSTDHWRMIVRVPGGRRHDLGTMPAWGRFLERDIVVSPAATISGRITREPGGDDNPPVRKTVVLMPLDAEGQPPRVTPRVAALSTCVMERDASFRFVGMRPGRYAVVAYVRGPGSSHPIAQEVSVSAGGSATVTLSHRQHPELDLQVTVPDSMRDREGRIGIKLSRTTFPDALAARFLQWSSGRAWCHREFHYNLGESGHKKLRIPAGDYEVVVPHRQHPGFARTTLHLDAGGSKVELDVRAYQPVTVRMPAPGPREYGVRGISIDGVGFSRTDDDRRTCQLGCLAPGTWRLSAHRYDRIVATRSITVGTQPLEIDWDFEAWPEPGSPGRPDESVSVIGSAGEPVPGATVFAVWRPDASYPDRTIAGDDAVARFNRLIWPDYQLIVFLSDGRLLLPAIAAGEPFWRWSPDDGPIRVQGHRTAHGLLVYAFHDLYSGHTHDRVTDDVGYSGLQNFDLLQAIGSHTITRSDRDAAVEWLDSWIQSNGRYSAVELTVLRNGETVRWTALAGDLAFDLAGHAIFLRP